MGNVATVKTRRAAGKPAENEDTGAKSADDGHANDETVTAQEQENVPATEENAEPDGESTGVATDGMEDEQEELSLDDIVLTSEDMPEELRNSGSESSAESAASEPSAPEPAASYESGPKSISASEPDDTSDEMGKIIRIEKILLSETNSADPDDSGNSDDMDDILENIEL